MTKTVLEVLRFAVSGSAALQRRVIGGSSGRAGLQARVTGTLLEESRASARRHPGLKPLVINSAADAGLKARTTRARQSAKFFARPILPVALLLLALCACKVGPNYKRPALNVPDQYRESADTTACRRTVWRDEMVERFPG